MNYDCFFLKLYLLVIKDGFGIVFLVLIVCILLLYVVIIMFVFGSFIVNKLLDSIMVIIVVLFVWFLMIIWRLDRMGFWKIIVRMNYVENVVKVIWG